MTNSDFYVIFGMAVFLICLLFANFARQARTSDQLRKQVWILSRRTYRLPDPTRSILLETPLGKFYLVQDYMATGPTSRRCVIYVYLPEDFGCYEEIIKELANVLTQKRGRYNMWSVPKDNLSGADAYVGYTGLPSNAPTATEMLQAVADILRENIVYPKGVTRLA